MFHTQLPCALRSSDLRDNASPSDQYAAIVRAADPPITSFCRAYRWGKPVSRSLAKLCMNCEAVLCKVAC